MNQDSYSKTDDFLNKVKQTNLKNNGVEFQQQSEKVREKSRKTKKDKYNDEFFTNSEKVLITKEKRYGDNSYNNMIKNQRTCFERYGVTSTMHLQVVYDKQQSALYKIKTHIGTNLYYQGTYELDFLNYCEKK